MTTTASSDAAPRDLTLRVDRFDPAGATIVVCGELDIHTAPALREQLLPLAAAGLESLVLDLTGVVFMDSVALAAIMHARRSMRDPHQLLIVLGEDSYPRVIFEATGLAGCLNIATARGSTP